ncbi:MAG TPA: hypothetical protein VFD37_07810, partial [Solirubrobacterales bacterium]|nr:hypothetical protein [Solirubrobacterales bacterium]
MTTHAELLALRDASRAAKAERDIAAGLAADAAGRLAAAEDALASAEQELGQARLELDTLAGLSDERDALLSAASQADVTAAADETAADGLAARIAEIER